MPPAIEHRALGRSIDPQSPKNSRPCLPLGIQLRVWILNFGDLEVPFVGVLRSVVGFSFFFGLDLPWLGLGF